MSGECFSINLAKTTVTDHWFKLFSLDSQQLLLIYVTLKIILRHIGHRDLYNVFPQDLKGFHPYQHLDLQGRKGAPGI